MGIFNIRNNYKNPVVVNFANVMTDKRKLSSLLTPDELKNLADAFNLFDKTAGEMSASERDTSNLSFDVVGDEWRALASKKDLTPDDIKKLDEGYRMGMLNLGTARVQTLDLNKNGVVEFEEFKASEQMSEEDLSLLLSDEKKQVEKMQDNAFKHLDIDGSGDIDKKEMAAYFGVVDFDFKNSTGINGKISVFDYASQSYQLGKSSKEKGGKMLDSNLKYSYNNLFGTSK